MHCNIPTYVQNLLPLSLNLTCPQTRPKKLNISWFDFLISFFQYWKHITFICKKYKFIDKLVGFINDWSITCWICSTQVFDWFLCRIQYKKNCFFTKKSLIPLSSLCRLHHETDCPRFDEYKQSHCGITFGLQSNSRYRKKYHLGVFPRTHSPTHRNVQPWQL